MKTAVITGIGGMDAKTLTFLLLSKNYHVILTYRNNTSQDLEQLTSIFKDDLIKFKCKLSTVFMDLADSVSIRIAIQKILLEYGQIDEFYNLSAQSHVMDSFTNVLYTIQVNGTGVYHILETLREFSPKTKTYQACHDTQTQVVCQKGVIPYTELKIGDLVYSLNPQTKYLELVPIKKIHEYDYNEQMIELKGRRINQLITPNHKIWLKRDFDEDFTVCEASDVKNLLPNARNSDFSLPICNKLENAAPKELIFSDYIDINNHSDNCSKNLIYKMQSDDFCFLLGIYLGDGYIKKPQSKTVKYRKENIGENRNKKGQFSQIQEKGQILRNYQGNMIFLCIPEKDKARPRTIALLKQLGISYKTDPINVSFSSFTLARMFELGGKGFKYKSIPEFIFSLDTMSLQALLDGLILSDGCYRTNRCVLSTSSPTLLSSSIRLCFMLGLYPSVTYQKQRFPKINGRIIKSTTQAYILNIGKKKTNKLYLHNIKLINYNGKVWCLELDRNHNFLVIRNGKLAFSGNCTSEMFGGDPKNGPFNEQSLFECRSPYSIGKLVAFNWGNFYKQTHNMFVCSGLLFNHSNFYRRKAFYIRKLTNTFARIVLGKETKIKLGMIAHYRDEHFSDFGCEMMWNMLQQSEPQNYVIGNGICYSGEEYLDLVGQYFNLDWKKYVEFDASFLRPNEVVKLVADPTKAEKELGWKRNRMPFKDHISLMAQWDYDLESGKTPIRPDILSLYP